MCVCVCVVKEEKEGEGEKDEYEEDLVAKAETEFFELIEKERKKQEREQAAKGSEDMQAVGEGEEKQDERKVSDNRGKESLRFCLMKKDSLSHMLLLSSYIKIQFVQTVNATG